MNENFWELLTKLEQLLIPYCAILNILQTDKAQLFEVLHGFAYLYQFWKKYPDSNISNGILIRLEKKMGIMGTTSSYSLLASPSSLQSKLFYTTVKFTY